VKLTVRLGMKVFVVLAILGVAMNILVATVAPEEEVIHDAADVARYVTNHRSKELEKPMEYEGCHYTTVDWSKSMGDFAYQSFDVDAVCKDRWKDAEGVMREGRTAHRYVVVTTPTSFSVDQVLPPELQDLDRPGR
jgi:hypothetical protein